MTTSIEDQIIQRINELRAWFASFEKMKEREVESRAELAKLEAAADALGVNAKPRTRARRGLAFEMVNAWALENWRPDWKPNAAQRDAVAQLILAKGAKDPTELLPHIKTIRQEVAFRAEWPPLPGSPEFARWRFAPKHANESADHALPSD